MAKRGRPKKLAHDFLGLFLKVKCPAVGTEVTIKLSEHDFYASEQDCEICGSHGEIKVNYKCTACGQDHEHEIQGW